MSSDWRKVARRLIEMLSDREGAAVTKDGHDVSLSLRTGDCLVLLSREDEERPRMGSSPKELRRWLWENRKDRRLGRETAVVWGTREAGYGLGAVARQGVGEKMRQRGFNVLEVT